LEWYRNETLPVIDYYRKRNNTIVFDIKGTDSIDGVHQQILNVLGLNS